MAYKKLLEERLDTLGCPLCDESFLSDQHIDSNESCFVIPAIAPYEENHILICSRKHYENISDGTNKEQKDLFEMIQKRSIKFHQTFGEFVVFIRQGSVLGVTGKSLPHLHWHIIPNYKIQYKNSQKESDARKVLSYDEMRVVANYLRKI